MARFSKLNGDPHCARSSLPLIILLTALALPWTGLPSHLVLLSWAAFALVVWLRCSWDEASECPTAAPHRPHKGEVAEEPTSPSLSRPEIYGVNGAANSKLRKEPDCSFWFSLTSYACCLANKKATRGTGTTRKEVPELPIGTRFAQAGVPAENVEGVVALAERLGLDCIEPLADPLTLWRFYRSRDCDVGAAAQMWRDTVSWRAKYSIKSVMFAYGIGEEYHADGSRAGDLCRWQWRYHGRTRDAEIAREHSFFGRLEQALPDGDPITIWRIGVMDLAGLVRENVVDILERAFVAHLEDCLQAGRAASLRNQRLVRCRMVLDAAGAGFHLLSHRAVIKRFMALGKAYFPEVNASVTIVRAPAAFAKLWVFVKPHLTPVMQKKICILGEDFAAGLREHAGVEKSALPDFLGGQAPDQICLARRIPEGLRASL